MEANASDIEILETPSEFYAQLLSGIGRAKKRISLASLYIGSHETELRDALHSALAANPDLHAHVLVDGMRGTRSGAKGSSTVALLSPLSLAFQKQTRVAFFAFPSKNPLRRLVGPRFNEAFGLQHMKAYVLDDDVIISGANLNSDYFTDRQDRYILIKNNPAVASYFANLIARVSDYSATLSHTQSNTLIPHSYSLSDIANGLKEFTSTANASIPLLNVNTLHLAPSAENEPETTITPLFQAGPLKIYDESNAFSAILKNLAVKDSAHVVCSSAYFNLPTRFHDAILQSRARFLFLLASPEANGFFGSKGVSRHVPYGYTFLTHQFWKKVMRTGNTHRIQINEYSRTGWTYHAKGLWISETPAAHPHMTMIGSSNYGYRSLNRDLEAQVVIRTRNEDLKRRMGENLQRLQGYSQPVDEKTFMAPHRVPTLFARIAARVIKGML